MYNSTNKSVISNRTGIKVAGPAKLEATSFDGQVKLSKANFVRLTKKNMKVEKTMFCGVEASWQPGSQPPFTKCCLICLQSKSLHPRHL